MNLVVEMCNKVGVEGAYKAVVALGGFCKLQKQQVIQWVHRADHPKRTPGPKVHFDFEIDGLQKTMLTVVRDSVVNRTISVVKIVVAVIYYYEIVKASCRETQKEWKVGLQFIS